MERRSFLRWGGIAAGAALFTGASRASAQEVQEFPAVTGSAPRFERRPASLQAALGGQPAVITPNGTTLRWTIRDGVKVGHLVAGEFEHEFAPGMRARVWGYNGRTPGPTIEAVEGERVRLYVTNRNLIIHCRQTSNKRRRCISMY